MTSKRLDYIDALRGIAVLLVLMVHVTDLANTAAFPPVLLNFNVSSG